MAHTAAGHNRQNILSWKGWGNDSQLPWKLRGRCQKCHICHVEVLGLHHTELRPHLVGPGDVAPFWLSPGPAQVRGLWGEAFQDLTGPQGTLLCQVAQHFPSPPAGRTPLLHCTSSCLLRRFLVFFTCSAAVTGKCTGQGVQGLTLGPSSGTHSLHWASVVFSVHWAGAGIKQDLC